MTIHTGPIGAVGSDWQPEMPKGLNGPAGLANASEQEWAAALVTGCTGPPGASERESAILNWKGGVPGYGHYVISHTASHEAGCERESNAADRSSPLESRRLWSLWDMLKEYMEAYISLGEDIHDTRILFDLEANFDVDPITKDRRLNVAGAASLDSQLHDILALAQRLVLPVTMRLIDRRLEYPSNLPQTLPEFEMLVEVLKDEVNSRLFLSVPPQLATYYEWDEIVSDAVGAAFPRATEEMRASGNCLAVGQYTACVFHAMRAAETGVRALAAALQVVLPMPIEMAEWQPILNGMKSRIEAIENLPRSTPNRDADLLFYNEAAAQFRFFKNGWRVRVAHARANYNELKAKEAIDHVRSFFEILVPRLSE